MAGFLAGVSVSRPFLFCAPDSAVLCHGCQPGQGGWAAAPWMPSASGVPRGRLKIEQQMLLFQRSICFMPETNVDFLKRLSITHNSF